MNNEYFEMNELDSVSSINTDLNALEQSKEHEKTQGNSGNSFSAPSYTNEGQKKKVETEEKKIRKTMVFFTLSGLLTIIVASALIFVILQKEDPDRFDEKYDMKETVFVTDSDSPEIGLISENVLGTGMMFEDSDILTAPEEGSPVAGGLSGGTNVLIYAAEGEYYKVSDPEKNVVGYVLKEKVNTGNIDLGNPDAAEEIVDDATGKVIGTEKPNTGVTSSTVNPEDFPVNSSPYFIYVEKGSHTITIFGKDTKGKYTVPLRTYLTATGRTASLTPVGNFTIKAKEKWHSWGNCYSPYCCKYYGSLFFHGPLYKERNFGTLMTGSVNQIGTNASSGCMRTSVQAAYFIYQFCWVGTNVKIVNGSPLNRSAGKPSVQSQYVDPATNLVQAAGIAFSFGSKTLRVGDTIMVTPEFTPSSASNKDCTWSTSNSGVASVSGEGASCTICALKEGSAIITASSIDGGYTASFTVTVLAAGSDEVSSVVSDAESDDASSEESSSPDSSSQDTSSQDVSSQEVSSAESNSTSENP